MPEGYSQAMLWMSGVILVAGLAAGAAIAWAIGASRKGAASEMEARWQAAAAEAAEKGRLLDAARERETAQREQLARAEATANLLNRQMDELRGVLDKTRTEAEQLRREGQAARLDAAELRTSLEGERKSAAEKIRMLQDAEKALSDRFERLANEIFEKKSQVFKQQNIESLTHLLTPVNAKFEEFQAKVEGLRKDGIEGRTELRAQIDNLQKLNQQLSADAANLVTALKGSSKTQGDWGEFVLEKLLESAGLREGHEYRVQQSFTREDRTRVRPDVILEMPGERHLVIDAKVSLSDYDAYCADEDEGTREAALERHIGSIRNHIRELAGKNYHALYGINSPDFVVMFVPIEPAFMLALAHDGRLWQEAWDRNVLLVSRTTLLFVLRTVAQLWRQERQTRNVEEIVRRGSELYDKLAAFAKDLTDVGRSLDAARQSYDGAYRKLATGRGNAIRQAEMLKSLGVKPTKALPLTLVEEAMDEPLQLAAVGEDGEAREAE